MVVCFDEIGILRSIVFRRGWHCDFLWLTALMPQSCSVTNVTRMVRSCQRTLWSRKRSMSPWIFTLFREACSASISSISGPGSFLAPHSLRRAETYRTSSNNSPEYIFKFLANGEYVLCYKLLLLFYFNLSSYKCLHWCTLLSKTLKLVGVFFFCTLFSY